jgi:thioredoxin-dependent peroxiredoxin
MVKVKAGDKASYFELPNQDNITRKLSDFSGRKILMFFYPKAGTSGWTTQAASVRDAGTRLEEIGVVPLGISPDLLSAQKGFAEKNSLGFDLLSDADHMVAEAYGAWGEKTMYGRKSQGVIRSAFLVDERGLIIEAFYKISPADTIPKALKSLGE